MENTIITFILRINLIILDRNVFLKLVDMWPYSATCFELSPRKCVAYVSIWKSRRSVKAGLLCRFNDSVATVIRKIV